MLLLLLWWWFLPLNIIISKTLLRSNTGFAVLLQVRLKDFQHAAKAQRASVTPAEILRYEEYNERHGAKYVLQQQEGQEDAESDGDDDW
jgi:hypothetical protein